MSTYYRNLNHYWKCRVQKQKFSDNPGHDILELYRVLVQNAMASEKGGPVFATEN